MSLPPSVQYAFDAAATEKLFVDSLLRTVQQRIQGQHFAGSVFRMPREGARPMRYLVDAILPESFDQGEIKFYVIGEDVGSNGVSEPFGTGVVFAPRSLTIAEIADFDGDGWADAAYCVWPRAEGTRGTAMAVGFVDGMWHEIEAPTIELLECNP